MIERFFELDDVTDVGIDEDESRVIIIGTSKEGEEIQTSLPSIDLPELLILLSRAYAILQVPKGESDLIYTQPVSDVQVLSRLKGGDVAVIVKMKTGVSVPFSIPESICLALRSQLDSLLSK